MTRLEEMYGRTKRLTVEEQRSMPYTEYLRSPEWRNRRIRALCVAGDACEECGVGYSLQVHHLTYERRGCELPEDLVVLCKTCHRMVHGL